MNAPIITRLDAIAARNNRSRIVDVVLFAAMVALLATFFLSGF